MAHRGTPFEQPDRGPSGAVAGEPAAVRIRLLGGFRVSVGASVVEDSGWGLRKAKHLVKLLALAPGYRLHREHLQDLLWPDSGEAVAGSSLHQALRHARRALQPVPAGGSSYLRLREEQVLLCPSGQLWTDVEAFERAAIRARRAHDPAEYRGALDLYAGDLLPEDRYEEWAERRREELRRLHLALLLELAGLREERGERRPATDLLEQAIRTEPLCEEAHAGLMRLYALSGRRNNAIRQYERLRETLRRELDAEPDPATRRSYEEIAGGRFPATAPLAPRDEREPLGASAPPGHTPPVQLSSFVGREREMAEVKRVFGSVRLLTLTGTGGCGKTRLALAVAGELAREFADGVRLVELAALTDPVLVPRATGEALGVPEQPGGAPTDALVEALRTEELLLVLDNCEHMADACARLASALLGACPYLKILATSREPLRVGGEVSWLVPSLSLPEPRRHPSIEQLGESDAVRLFVERARSRRASFRLTADNGRSVVEICSRLGGVPLAIELAAARVNVLAVEQIAARLDDSLRLLVGDSRTAPPRQQTVRAALDWSYELLDERGRALFEGLGVFVGGWDLEAAEAVGAGPEIGTGDVLDVLSRLVDKSLVLVEESGGEARYRLLEPVRQYARERLEASGEAETVRRRHAGYYAALAEEADEGLRGADQAAWLDRLETEHDNLRAALGWALQRGETAIAPRLGYALWGFWSTRGYLSEGRTWLMEVLALEGAPPRARVRVLFAAGRLALQQGDYSPARSLLEECLMLARRLNDLEFIAAALTQLGHVARKLGDDAIARDRYEESLAIRRRLGDERYIAIVLQSLGAVAHAQGDRPAARRLLEESVALSRESGDRLGLAHALTELGLLELAEAEHTRAAVLLRESLAIRWELGDHPGIADSLEALAVLAAAQQQPARAARQLGAAGSLRETTATRFTRSQNSRYQPHLDAARARPRGTNWARAHDEGRAMALDRAVEYALAEEPAPPTVATTGAPPGDPPPSALTPRERAVAEFVARGLTNRRIAAELTLSERTVDTHVGNILKKLGIESRARLAAWATEHRLLARDVD